MAYIGRTKTEVIEDTTPQLGGDLDCNGAQIQWSKGADVASATALPVLTDGNYFDVTGTTTVTSIILLVVLEHQSSYILMQF